MTLDTVTLSRLQFAFTVGFHILWPAYSIGIACFVALLNALWLSTGKTIYRNLMRFWIHLFALGFVMGVVTGVVLSYEIGANWSVFSRITGNVLGPLFMYEALTAFFLEGGFIGIMLFGEARVGRRVHFFSSLMVALATILSAFWVLAANSWMQTPQGATLGHDGVFHVNDWATVIFNPSLPYRFAHMVCASFVSGVFVVAGVSAIFLLRQRNRESARAALSLAMWLALFLVPFQMILGDQHGLNTRRYQPIKLAAMEARWDTGRGVPLTLFALPDQEKETNLWSIDIPYLGSLILTHSWNGDAMVGIGIVLLTLSIIGAYLRRRGHLFTTKWFLIALILASPLGFVATIAGWIVTEAGRQPYVVYGLLRTADGASPLVAVNVGVTLIIFIIVYTLLLAGFFWFFAQTIIRGAELTELPDSSPRSARGRMRATPEMLKGTS